MNDNPDTPNAELLRYQTQRFQDLLEETLQCCQTRTMYLSHKFGIPQAEMRCLMLFLGERYLTVKDIAQKLEVAKSRVTKIVEGLIQKELLERTTDPRDARVKLISLTPRGQKQSRAIRTLVSHLHEKVMLELQPDQRKMVLTSLELLRSSMEAIKQQLV